jgi:hypothetical protein
MEREESPPIGINEPPKIRKTEQWQILKQLEAVFAELSVSVLEIDEQQKSA